MAVKNKMPIWDQRMLIVMEFAIANELNGCTNQEDFCKMVGAQRSAIAQIRNLKSSFRHKHILKAWEVFGVSPNYTYGITAGMFLKPADHNPFVMIKEAVRMLEKK